MARELDEIENELNALEAELEAMSGFEDRYPEHYQRLRDDWERVKREHEAALDVGMSLPPADPPNRCIDPDQEEAESHYDDEQCFVLPVAGIGENICLIDPDDDTPEDELAGLGPVEHFGRKTVLADGYRLSDEVNRVWKFPEKNRNGSSSFEVSMRIAANLEKVMEEVHAAGGVLTSGGGFRGLLEKVSQGRIATSFHYSGLAVDLYTLTGTLNAEHDRYVIAADKDDERYWRVYCRSESQPEITLEAQVFDPITKILDKVPCTGRFFDLTAIFEKNGFTRIPPQLGFRKNMHISNQIQMEWWHFQVSSHLQARKTKFGEVLLEIHSYKDLKGTPPWTSRKALWNGKIFN